LTVEQVEQAFDGADAWLRSHAPGREVYLGAFGVFDQAPQDSRRNYIAAIRKAAEKRGWGWVVWAYNGGCAVRDDSGMPTAIHEGLFCE
jgi:endoglucanase